MELFEFILCYMKCTSHDVACCDKQISVYSQEKRNQMTMKYIVVYLRRHKENFIVSDGSKLKLVVPEDSSFSRDQFDSRSMSGHLIVLSGRTVSWNSFKLQTLFDIRSGSKMCFVASVLQQWIGNLNTYCGSFI